jgi:hypothetical protein
VSQDPKAEDKGGLKLSTLLISSCSAVAAAVIVPMFWERGSLIATAVTPIIVALVSEALNRPAKVITDVAPKVAPRVVRRTGAGAPVRVEQPTGVGARGERPERVSRWGDEDDPFGLRTPARAQRRRRFPWKLGLATGLAAAVIGAAVVTASELAIFGHSVGGKERSTSVFGGETEHSRRPQETPTPAATETATPTPTSTPTPTETVTPQATETPVPTVSPSPTPSVEATPEVAPSSTPTIAPTP